VKAIKEDPETPVGRLERAFREFVSALEDNAFRQGYLKDETAPETIAYWRFCDEKKRYDNDDGRFWFKAIKPVPYPIPHDGPGGELSRKLKRHPYRPSHMHFMFEKPGYDSLTT
jgi:Dioxygenase